MNTTTSKPINIYLEANPNPNSLKFVTDFLLVETGDSFDFPDKESAAEAPLAKKLFETFDFVERVFYMSNFITVTKHEKIDWMDVQNDVKALIKKELENNTELFTSAYKQAETTPDTPQSETSELDEKIIFVLNEYVKPAVEQDGGAISFQSFKDGIVKVQLQGSCSGCPSSTVTLKAGIENLLKRMVPEVTAVEAEGV
jgi:Fe-S cluster biogenesis protein NfuA